MKYILFIPLVATLILFGIQTTSGDEPKQKVCLNRKALRTATDIPKNIKVRLETVNSDVISSL